MVDWKRKKLWVEQKTSQAYTQRNIFYWQLEAPHRKQLKQHPEKKVKNSRIYNTFNGSPLQEWIDWRYWSLLWYVRLTKVMNNTYVWFRIVLVSTQLAQRCGTVENESCADIGFRRCDNVALRRCQDVATTLLQHRGSIKYCISRPFYYSDFFPSSKREIVTKVLSGIKHTSSLFKRKLNL